MRPRDVLSSAAVIGTVALVVGAGFAAVAARNASTPQPAADEVTVRYVVIPGHVLAAPPQAAAPTVHHVNTVAGVVSRIAGNGIPVIALDAYRRAADELGRVDPSCGISWSLLAAIGRIESDHGRFGGTQVLANGNATQRIVGPALDGANGTARIASTDGGRYEGDRAYAHAVGPMQFLPSTWARVGVDGNGDGVADPFNMYDAALSAANYLCMSGADLRTAVGRQRAVFSYNHDGHYVAEVLALAAAY